MISALHRLSHVFLTSVLGGDFLYHPPSTENEAEVKYFPPNYTASQQRGRTQSSDSVLPHPWIPAPELASEVLLFLGGSTAWHFPKQLPSTWGTARPLLPFAAPPTAMWANTLPLPRQGTPDLHNLIKFCILGFEGAGL